MLYYLMRSFIVGMKGKNHGFSTVHFVHLLKGFQKTNLHCCLHVKNVCSFSVQLSTFEIGLS